MNKSFLKFVADFGPLLIFFTIYYKSGNNLAVAIPPLIIATIIAVISMYLLEKKIPYIPLIGGVLVSLFGGLTLYFNNPIFIFLAILNELVWRTQPETTWVNFKVWGLLPLTFIFTAFQVPLINKHKI